PARRGCELRRGETGRRGHHARSRRRRADDDHDAALQHPSGRAADRRGTIDLFAAASAEGAWTVTDVTRRARSVVEAGLPPLWVRGEISGFKAWRSGHWYFALRDRFSQLRCVMLGKENRRVPEARTEGLEGLRFAMPAVL